MIKEEECRFNCLESCWYLSTDTTPELPSVCSCFTSVTFTLTLRHLCLLHQQGSFSFCNVEFPVIPVVPHLPASDYSASSSSSNSSCANADMFPLCCNYTFIFVGTLAEEKAQRKQGLQGLNLYVDGVIFLLPWHCAISICFRISKSNKVVYFHLK